MIGCFGSLFNLLKINFQLSWIVFNFTLVIL